MMYMKYFLPASNLLQATSIRYVYLKNQIKESKRPTTRLVQVTKVRWGYDTQAVITVCVLYEEIILALDDLVDKDEDNDAVCTAQGLLTLLADLDFVIRLSVYQDLLKITSTFSKALQ